MNPRYNFRNKKKGWVLLNVYRLYVRFVIIIIIMADILNQTHLISDRLPDHDFGSFGCVG